MSTAAFKRRLAAIERKLAKPPPYVAVPSPRVQLMVMLYGKWKPGKSVITCYRKAAGYRSDGALFKIATKDGDPFRERWQAMGGNPADAEAAREEILTRFIIEELQHCAFEAAAVLGLWMPGHPMPLSNHRPLRERAAAGRWFDRLLERDFRCLIGVHPSGSPV